MGDPRPGLKGRLQGGEAMVMPLASSLGANHEDQSVAPPFANSYTQASKQQLVMGFYETALQ